MTNQITPYIFNGKNSIRVINDNNEPLFCLADICKILNLSTPAKTANQIKEEFGVGELNSYSFNTGYGVKDFTMITEPQLYFVMMRSNSKIARDFRQWICNDVLPTLRKTGSYTLKLNDTFTNLIEIKEQTNNFKSINDFDNSILNLERLKAHVKHEKAIFKNKLKNNVYEYVDGITNKLKEMLKNTNNNYIIRTIFNDYISANHIKPDRCILMYLDAKTKAIYINKKSFIMDIKYKFGAVANDALKNKYNYNFDYGNRDKFGYIQIN